MTADIRPGLLVLHGNRLELLRDTVFAWIESHPLQPLEEEVFLVQSNGVAEWLKMALAESQGICAATRVELPARFLWRAWRQVLGRNAVPAQSPLGRQALVWRFMRLLPLHLERADFAPLARFLGEGADTLLRRLQLAQRLADLYDQYQVYRADWLDAWGRGQDELPRPQGQPLPVPADQRWQPALWRELLAGLDEAGRQGVRPRLHRRVLQALASGQPPAAPLPRRVVLFGMSHVPMQTLEALAALAGHTQVVMCIPNPCQYHWADLIDGRELLQLQRRRQPLRQGRELADIPVEDLHAHGHPLLAAWGRQGRDFVRLLDVFDDAQAARQQFSLPRIDLFDDGEGQTLLEQVQARIRDLVPLAPDEPPAQLEDDDRSIVFHIAHSAQRELEILQDRLLALLAQPPGGRPLAPRDVVVMVPDIAAFAPAIQAVFGQYARQDPRYIPFEIADQQQRGHNPLLVALEWLLRLPQHRFRVGEIRDLLEVPGIARRFGLGEEDRERLMAWIDGAGVRWGLHAGQRAALGLEVCGEQNTWLFGLQRMLLGYASGEDADFAGIEPYAEVAGLEAGLAGSLALLLDRLAAWEREACRAASPAEWTERARRLLDDFVDAGDEMERLSVAALEAALARWREACDAAGFDEAVPLAVLREAWLSGVDEPTLNRRFRGGGVTFCTLMPMRAIPFEVVCLLGMNDGDYPRQTSRTDFDLMSLPQQRRPGDRSKRDDDRYLVLEALLSARRVLYVSWTGRSVRDNSEQPPSVLVAQLRDYLRAGWGEAALARLTTEHPLQPFSRRYFEQDAPAELYTFAREWRSAHAGEGDRPAAAGLPPYQPEPGVPLGLQPLVDFLNHPVREFFRVRLDVRFEAVEEALEQDEPFHLAGLAEYQLLAGLLDSAAAGDWQDADALVHGLQRRALQQQRAGRLPLAALAGRARHSLLGVAEPMVREWQRLRQAHPRAYDKQPLRFEHDGLVLEDWLEGLHDDQGRPLWIEMRASRLAGVKRDEKKGSVSIAWRPERLLGAWVRTLVAAACGIPLRGMIVGRDAVVTVEALPAEQATGHLQVLMETWREGMAAPLPLSRGAGFAYAMSGDAAKAAPLYDGQAGARQRLPAERDDPFLARVFPDFEALCADGRFAPLAGRLYLPVWDWLKQHGRAVALAGAADLAGEAGDE